MKNNRQIRINDEIMRETAKIIQTELKDPRISAMTSVTKVDTTNDLSYSTIYVSVLGEDEQKEDVLKGLKSSSKFIRKLLADRINLRLTPELRFVIDDSIEYSQRIDRIIKEINENK